MRGDVLGERGGRRVRWIAVANSFPTHLKVFFSFSSKKSYARNGGGGKGAAQASEQESVAKRRQTRSGCGFLEA